MPRVIHLIGSPQRHTLLPFLWRVRCSCGWTALAPDRFKCEAAKTSHYDEYVNPQISDTFEEEFGPYDPNRQPE